MSNEMKNDDETTSNADNANAVGENLDMSRLDSSIMNECTLNDFEAWAEPLEYDLKKSSAMRTENPYSVSATWKAYEAWCAALARKEPESTTLDIYGDGPSDDELDELDDSSDTENRLNKEINEILAKSEINRKHRIAQSSIEEAKNIKARDNEYRADLKQAEFEYNRDMALCDTNLKSAIEAAEREHAVEQLSVTDEYNRHLEALTANHSIYLEKDRAEYASSLEADLDNIVADAEYDIAMIKLAYGV